MQKILSILCVLCFSPTINAQKLKTSKDSIHVFYGKLFSVMENGYLYNEKVDWPKIKSEVNHDLENYNDFQTSLKEVSTILDFAKADYCSVNYKESSSAGYFAGPNAKDFSAQWQKKFAINPALRIRSN